MRFPALFLHGFCLAVDVMRWSVAMPLMPIKLRVRLRLVGIHQDETSLSKPDSVRRFYVPETRLPTYP